MITLKNENNRFGKVRKTLRTLVLQIETTVGFLLGGVVMTAILLNANAL